jgi:flagellar hook assembly protein FlgD
MKGDLCIRAIVTSSGVEQEPCAGKAIVLNQNSPNPVLRKTSISYTLPRRVKTELRIYSVTGRLVRVLVNGIQEPGGQEVTWDRRNEQGQEVHSGIYFYRLSTGCGTPLTKPMTVL